MKFKSAIGLFRIQFLKMNHYRISAVNNGVSVLFYGFIQTSILLAFYRFGKTDSIGMTASQAVSYAWLTQALHFLLPIFNDGELQGQIVSGDFIYELCRPIDLYRLWYARLAATRLAPTLFYIPFIVIPTMFLPEPYRLMPPASLAAGLATIPALMTALLTATAFSCILNILFLRVELGRGVAAAFNFGICLLSGAEVPLPILPDGIMRILRWLPFAGMMDTPCSLYLGIIAPSSAALYIVRQAAWTTAVICIGRQLLNRNLRRVVVQGG